MSRVRHAAAWTYRVLSTLLAGAVIVEVFLAGLGVFGAMAGKNVPVSHDTFDDEVGVPAASGGFLTGGSLLLLIVFLIAWTGLSSRSAAVGLAVLTLVEGALGGAAGDVPVAGAFHAVSAVLVPGLAVFLTVRAWRENLLIPSAQWRRIAPASEPAASMAAPTPTPVERVE